MCIGFWTLDHPDYALVICSNRDEYLSRSTLKAHFHSFDQSSDTPANFHPILSGRDLQAGGSWFGTNRSGRVALLTNITEPPASYKSSRGHLVSSFLVSDSLSLGEYIQNLTNRAQPDYAGFNLLLFSPSSLEPLSYDAHLVTNSGGGGVVTSRRLNSGERTVGGLSNGIDGLGGNDWPKVREGRCALENILGDTAAVSSEEELTRDLFKMLTLQSSEPPSNRFQLRNSIQILPLRVTPSLSIDARADGPEYYGTRLSTVLLIRRDGEALFIERYIWQLDSNGEPTQADPRSERIFRFKVAPPGAST